MPTYSFQCKECQHEVDYIVKIADMDEPLGWECPNCKAVALKRTYGTNTAFMSPESLGRNKAPREFRDFLSAIKKVNPGCHIRDH